MTERCPNCGFVDKNSEEEHGYEARSDELGEWVTETLNDDRQFFQRLVPQETGAELAAR